jgi:electron transport complex protein RnfG
MKKTIIIFAVALMSAASCSDPNMHKNSDGSFTIVTTELCKDIRGYNGRVPAEVTIKDGVIQDVKILENKETPSYLEKVEREVLPKFRGINLSEIPSIEAVSGATFTSRALRKNLEAAAEYYEERK